MQMTLYIKCPACLSDNIKKNGFKSYTPRELAIYPC
ncbi:IS1 family transposase, partial [Psychrobacter celer]